MSGQAVSGRSQKETRQLPPLRCARCGKRLRDGAGRHLPGTGIVCPKCGTPRRAGPPPLGAGGSAAIATNAICACVNHRSLVGVISMYVR